MYVSLARAKSPTQNHLPSQRCKCVGGLSWQPGANNSALCLPDPKRKASACSHSPDGWRREDGSSPRTQEAPLRSPGPAGPAGMNIHPSIHVADIHPTPTLCQAYCVLRAGDRIVNKTDRSPLSWPHVLAGERDFKTKQNTPKQINKDFV